ncbi:hypothetical protein AB0F46_18810 [Streptomyces sp. NPDC026665]|uniref:hypothetical protein n=1 Tax=Streptomyces sp. NPDC026665 TaxID=3154798 RepID=UPI0033EBAEAE
MTETTVRPYPEAPDQVAAAVLDAIEALPEAFSMTAWFWSRGSRARALAPEQTPRCGTTLCVAGWTVHVTGWTLHADGVSCSKDGITRDIEATAQDALGLTYSNLFYGSPDDAIAGLRQIAGRADTP